MEDLPDMSSQDLTLFLLPGLDGTGRLFRRLIESAPSHWRTQVVSYPREIVLDYRALETLVVEQFPDGPFVLLGESFSGPLAVSLAARRPSHLRGLVLAASFVTPPAWRAWRFLPWRLAFRLPVPAALLRCLMAPGDHELGEELREALRGVAPEVLAERVREVLSVERREALAALDCPVLCLQPRHDRVVSSRCLHEALQVKPDIRVELLSDAHLVLQRHPLDAWRAVMAWVGEMVEQ
jgi:pimeloyl-[acyl-carrier protein] methyl ester esterase